MFRELRSLQLNRRFGKNRRVSEWNMSTGIDQLSEEEKFTYPIKVSVIRFNNLILYVIW